VKYEEIEKCLRLICVVGGGGISLACFHSLICEAASEGMTHETVRVLLWISWNRISKACNRRLTLSSARSEEASGIDGALEMFKPLNNPELLMLEVIELVLVSWLSLVEIEDSEGDSTRSTGE
jgi:hypothetical protein